MTLHITEGKEAFDSSSAVVTLPCVTHFCLKLFIYLNLAEKATLVILTIFSSDHKQPNKGSYFPLYADKKNTWAPCNRVFFSFQEPCFWLYIWKLFLLWTAWTECSHSVINKNFVSQREFKSTVLVFCSYTSARRVTPCRQAERSSSDAAGG